MIPLLKALPPILLAPEPLENIILKLDILRHAARPLQLQLQPRLPPSVPSGRERPAVSRLLLQIETGPSLGGRQPHPHPAGTCASCACSSYGAADRSPANARASTRPARHAAQVG